MISNAAAILTILKKSSIPKAIEVGGEPMALGTSKLNSWHCYCPNSLLNAVTVRNSLFLFVVKLMHFS